jgi:hypothetical protein
MIIILPSHPSASAYNYHYNKVQLYILQIADTNFTDPFFGIIIPLNAATSVKWILFDSKGAAHYNILQCKLV